MAVVFSSGYTLPGGDEPLTHARICHAGTWVTGGTVTASTAADYSADGPANSLTYDRWKPSSMPGSWTYAHGSTVECDYCAIAAHTLGTDGATVYIRYDDGTGTYINLVAPFVPTDDSPILAIFPPRSAENWRIRVEGSTAPEIGVIRFGTALQMPVPIYGGHAPLEFQRNVTMRTNESETGEVLGRSVERRSLATSYQWTHITRAWADANLLDLQRNVEAEPFFLAWRPGEVAAGVGYCLADSPPKPANMGRKTYMSLDLSVRGWIDG